jgi:hypothetical protein
MPKRVEKTDDLPVVELKRAPYGDRSPSWPRAMAAVLRTEDLPIFLGDYHDPEASRNFPLNTAAIPVLEGHPETMFQVCLEQERDRTVEAQVMATGGPKMRINQRLRFSVRTVLVDVGEKSW